MQQPSPLNQLSCTALKGVGPHVAECLRRLQIETVQDLLFHLPFRYQDRTHVTPLADLRPGDHAVIEGVIDWMEIKRGRRTSLLCHIHDHAGQLTLRFFHFNLAQQQHLAQPGTRIRCFGEVRWGISGYEMVHPEYRLLQSNVPIPVEEHLTPIYSTTEGLSQQTLRKLSDQALRLLQQRGGLEDYVPQTLWQNFQLPGLTEALWLVHQPPPDASILQLLAGSHPAQQRLAFEELMAQQLSRQRLRQHLKQQMAPVFNQTSHVLDKFLTQLPFQLTNAQQRVLQEIKQDLAQPSPMLRLVQGDVGSGKTVVAALAALQVIGDGYQAAVMAPTELLAEQHFQNFQHWLKPLNFPVVYLAGKLKGKNRQEILQKIANGDARLVIGTHALFQEDVAFNRLALLVIDEQHRFGVQQRLALRSKGMQNGYYPHQLMMTATPIPRTLAMTAYADLDCSIIDELPPGRTPVTTVVISNQRRQEVLERVRHNCREGKQAYWVCTLVEESEVLQCQAAEATTLQLQTVLPELRIGLVHGRLKALEKERIMAAFKAAEFDLLVATTVVEVGVDVPNASLMIIENAERLGLAQLHQLRGRVGRGAVQSHCVLLYQTPLSPSAKERLTIMRTTQDGFVIAKRDLELRGPGEVLGTRQTGIMQLKIADLQRDRELLPDVRRATEFLLQCHSTVVEPLIRRWLGTNEQYGNV
ncbi:MAG: ATP-dependent DNA helicase RecG [Gammaproteobacteria bacterium]